MYIWRYCAFILLVLLIFQTTGCVTSQGYSTQTSLEVPTTIRSPSEIPADLVGYLPKFVSILEAQGFAVGHTQDARALELVLQFDGDPFNFEVTVSLWGDGKPILTASAINPGWGTAINPSGALRSRVDSAASVFESELEELMTHTQIVPDRADTSTRSQESESQGTCFVAGPNGVVITSYHVIDGAHTIMVTLHDGRRLPAVVDRSSAANDVAVLRVSEPTPDFLSFGSARSVQLGDQVFTIGFPSKSILGSAAKFTEGSVSALSGLRGESSYMQISVPVQPGNSGGPVVTHDGSVVGVIAATAAVEAFYEATGALPQNVNWAVKSDYVRPMLDESPPRTAAQNRSESIARTQSAVCEVTASP
jgi:S1-C subfamily serine protease